MKHGKLACAALLALGCSSGFAAGGTAYDLLDTTTISVAENITDIYSFTLTEASGVMLNVFTSDPLRTVDLATLQLIGPSGTFALLGRIGDDGMPMWSFAARSLVPGDYTVVAIGAISTPKLFSADLDVSPSPVPEPASLPLMLAGLAATGLMLRRHRS